jgi:hypothetical protein
VIAALRRADIEKPSLNNTQNLNRNTMTQVKIFRQPFAKLPVICRLLLGIVWGILCLNVGVFAGKMIAKLIIGSGVLPYLDRFFSWVIF